METLTIQSGAGEIGLPAAGMWVEVWISLPRTRRRSLDRRGCVKLAMLTPPASYRIVGGRQIVLCEPGGGPAIVSVPRELVDKDRPARAEKVGERPDHSVKVSVVQRHDGGNCVKLT